ncbi:MAG: hypothetical protein AAB734_02660 [Patescibacteria group bacterium]
MPKKVPKAVVLATHNGNALLMRITKQGVLRLGWRLPRWVKRDPRSTWEWNIVGYFKCDLNLDVRRERLRHIKEVMVGKKKRVFFAIDLTEDEADLMRIGQVREGIETRLVHVEDLDHMDDFGDREQELLLALKN